MKQSIAHNDDQVGDRITLIIPSLTDAAVQLHRQQMWSKGYQLESKIECQTFFASDGREIDSMFDGKAMYSATFIKRETRSGKAASRLGGGARYDTGIQPAVQYRQRRLTKGRIIDVSVEAVQFHMIGTPVQQAPHKSLQSVRVI